MADADGEQQPDARHGLQRLGLQHRPRLPPPSRRRASCHAREFLSALRSDLPLALRLLQTGNVAPVDLAQVTAGFLYLVAIMDWASRHVLAWRLSNTMDTGFCIEALEAALRTGTPEIFNTDQGAQFTSATFTERVLAAGAQCSMDGRGRCLDNVFIERLWRSLKYEAV